MCACVCAISLMSSSFSISSSSCLAQENKFSLLSNGPSQEWQATVFWKEGTDLGTLVFSGDSCVWMPKVTLSWHGQNPDAFCLFWRGCFCVGFRKLHAGKYGLCCYDQVSLRCHLNSCWSVRTHGIRGIAHTHTHSYNLGGKTNAKESMVLSAQHVVPKVPNPFGEIVEPILGKPPTHFRTNYWTHEHKFPTIFEEIIASWGGRLDPFGYVGLFFTSNSHTRPEEVFSRSRTMLEKHGNISKPMATGHKFWVLKNNVARMECWDGQWIVWRSRSMVGMKCASRILISWVGLPLSQPSSCGRRPICRFIVPIAKWSPQTCFIDMETRQINYGTKHKVDALASCSKKLSKSNTCVHQNVFGIVAVQAVAQSHECV